jgi:FkbM family methyltransferase
LAPEGNGPAVESEPLAAERDRTRLKAERAARKALRARREAFFAEAQDLTPYLAVQIGEELIFVPTGDVGLGKGVFARRGRKDITVLGRAVAWLAENDVPRPAEPVFVDVGANIGTTTVAALRRHGYATAVALEPSPDNFHVLRLNLVANGLESRVHALPVAASDRDGELALDVSRPNWGGHRIAAEAAASSSGYRAVAQALTLDGLVDTGAILPERTGLVWIDAPTHEGNVVIGAARLLESGPPLVMAIRPVRGSDEQARPWDVPGEARAAAIATLTANYTEVVELRKKSKQGRRRHPIDVLPVLVDSFRRCQDLLFVRR